MNKLFSEKIGIDKNILELVIKDRIGSQHFHTYHANVQYGLFPFDLFTAIFVLFFMSNSVWIKYSKK